MTKEDYKIMMDHLNRTVDESENQFNKPSGFTERDINNTFFDEGFTKAYIGSIEVELSKEFKKKWAEGRKKRKEQGDELIADMLINSPETSYIKFDGATLHNKEGNIVTYFGNKRTIEDSQNNKKQ